MNRHRSAAAIASLIVLGGCSHGVQPSALPATQASHDQPTPSPSTPPSPSPSPRVTMTNRQACQRVVEASVDFVYLAAKTKDNPTLDGIEPGDLQTVSGNIRDALPFLDKRTAHQARELTYPLDTMYGILDTGEDGTINFEDARAAVPEVLESCEGKASLKDYVSPYQP